MYQSKLKPPHTQKNILYSLMLFGMGAIVGGFAGVFIFMYITGGSAQPSEPISAPSLSLAAAGTVPDRIARGRTRPRERRTSARSSIRAAG